MVGTEVLNFIRPEILILIPVLIIVGLALKKVSYIKDWTIPIILGGVSVVMAILTLGFSGKFDGPTLLNGVIQGILAAGMAVYVHQITIQTTQKRFEDE